MLQGATLNSLNLWPAVTWTGCCTWLHTSEVHPLAQSVPASSCAWRSGLESGVQISAEAGEALGLVGSPQQVQS